MPPLQFEKVVGAPPRRRGPQPNSLHTQKRSVARPRGTRLKFRILSRTRTDPLLCFLPQALQKDSISGRDMADSGIWDGTRILLAARIWKMQRLRHNICTCGVVFLFFVLLPGFFSLIVSTACLAWHSELSAARPMNHSPPIIFSLYP